MSRKPKPKLNLHRTRLTHVVLALEREMEALTSYERRKFFDDMYAAREQLRVIDEAITETEDRRRRAANRANKELL